MRAVKSGKRPVNKAEDGALVGRFTGELPRAAAEGRKRSAEWVSGIAGSAAGKSLKSLISEHPRLAAMLGGIAGTAPYLWELICADPDRFRRLLTNRPEEQFTKLMKSAQRSGATQGSPGVMRSLRRMKAEAALLIALADIGGV